MKLVSESLEQLYDKGKLSVSPYLYEALLAEGIQFKNPKDAIKKAVRLLPNLAKNKRINLLTLLFLLNTGAVNVEGENRQAIENNKYIVNLAEKPRVSASEIEGVFDLMAPPIKAKPNILQMTSAVIDAVDSVRFSKNKLDQYNQYDEDILKAVKELRDSGENVNADLIKAIMLIETGMKPSKNSLGFEGFPQTKEKFIDGINKRYNTNFTMKDMYDPYESAKFIHYYLDALGKSKWVDSVADIAIAYNWGIGNLGKYKRGEKKLPDQSKTYVKLLKSLELHYPSV